MTETTVDTATTLARDNPAEQYLPDFVARWDELIDWDRRKAGEEGFFRDLLLRDGARDVLDVAAGTGYHAVTLAEEGFRVTAVDISDEMIRHTVRNAVARGQAVHAKQADWRGLGSTVDGDFDAVVCLGSSFPHLFSESDRVEVLREFRAKLRPGGRLVIDHRNFDAIREREYRSSGNFYYCGTEASVEVEHVDPRLCRFRYAFADGAVYRLEVYPILQAELRRLLELSGFTDVESFGDFQPGFDRLRPDFVIHTARKS